MFSSFHSKTKLWEESFIATAIMIYQYIIVNALYSSSEWGKMTANLLIRGLIMPKVYDPYHKKILTQLEHFILGIP